MSRLAIVLTALSLSLLAFAPIAGATHLPPCRAEVDDTTGTGWYVHTYGATVEVWHEKNGVPGLQTYDCTTPDGNHHAKDFRNVRMGVPELPCIPVFQPCPL